MNRETDGSRVRYLLMAVAALVLLGVAGLGVWLSMRRPPAGGGPASAEVVADFYTGLAALDVEENQLASTLLTEAVAAQPAEPALWANLTVAHLRLRDMEGARRTLARAVDLAGEAPEILALQAEALEQSGDIEGAIEALRRVHEIQPENTAAAHSLASLLARLRTPEADRERLALLTDILARSPENLRARSEQARLAATLEEAEALNEAIGALTQDIAAWPEAAQERLASAREAASEGRFRDAATALTIFENLVKPTFAYQQGVAELGASDTAIGEPLRRFLTLTAPAAEAAPADRAMTFSVDPVSEEDAARPDLVLAMPQVGERRSTLLSLSNSMLQVGVPAALPFPGSSSNANTTRILPADLNNDFRLDLTLAGPEGCRIYLQQEDGAFAEQEQELADFSRAWRSVWAADIEGDGDLDLLLSDHQSALACLQNNGDMTFTAVDHLSEATGVLGLTTIDLDNDGDVDIATLDESGRLAVWLNDRSARYVAGAPPTDATVVAMTAGDVNRDGAFDLISLSEDGAIERHTLGADGQWAGAEVVSWAPAPPGDAYLLEAADLDNNGAVDVIASTANRASIWLGDEQSGWTPLANAPPMLVTSIVDMNDDGLLDLVGMTDDAGAVATNESGAGYGWLLVEPRATPGAGDQRFNSFGIGGTIEVRAGLLVQAAAIRSPRVHFGLGRHASADVARIVWPNGTVQAEFDLASNETVDALQRLKGSCPWVFAYDGKGFHFVKDFIWRSPLGLRINAQDTAGVTQTEDWIKVPGPQLAEVDGLYSLRITAELWETHFFDHVSLLAVDHPADVEVFVDERFVATAPQDQTIIETTPPEPVATAIDSTGRSWKKQLTSQDDEYVDGFALGEHQGVAEEHWVEFTLPDDVDADRTVLLVANGWVYPTDSSLNVAIAQGDNPQPLGLVLEQFDPQTSQWRTLREGLGFPAGKNKDAVIELPAGSLQTSCRFRLRTTTETYWDSLGWAYRVTDTDVRSTPAPTHTAELRYRGYSKLTRPTERRRPDIPRYEVEATGQRWRDLEGYYTRLGDVRELLEAIDDRYVIMNAGDEMVLEFSSPGDVPSGWRRDFILIGDGWVKDGDVNTAFSRWVRPLPTHDASEYSGPLGPLLDETAYRRHADDWLNYHTRYVTPRHFQRGLWPPTSHRTAELAP